MLSEFVKNFKNACNENGVDILDEYWDNHPNRVVNSASIEVMYSGITFYFEIYIWDNVVHTNGGVTSLMLKGVEYYPEHFSMIESEELIDGPADIEEMLDFITNCEVKKRMIKLSHAVDEFFESYNDDFEQEFILEYIKMHYDNY